MGKMKPELINMHPNLLEMLKNEPSSMMYDAEDDCDTLGESKQFNLIRKIYFPSDGLSHIIYMEYDSTFGQYAVDKMSGLSCWGADLPFSFRD